MMEVWLPGADKPCAKRKHPQLVTLIDRDTISIRARGAEVELERETLFRLCRQAIKDVLYAEQIEKLAEITVPKIKARWGNPPSRTTAEPK